VVSDTGFDQMPQAVELVLDLQVLPARPRKVDLVIGVKVTVLLLRCFKDVDEFCNERAQAGIGVTLQDLRGGFQPLVGVGISEEKPEPEPLLESRGNAEVIDTTRVFQLLPLVVNGGLRVQRKP